MGFSFLKSISTHLPDPTHFFGLDWVGLTGSSGFAQSMYTPKIDNGSNTSFNVQILLVLALSRLPL
jgi:hypothetical protein